MTPLFRHSAILTPSEKEGGQKDVGHEDQGKETERDIKMGKDEKGPKPAGSTTISLGSDPDEDTTPSMFLRGFTRC